MIQLQALNYILDSKNSSVLTVSGIDDSFFSDYIEEYRFIANHISQYGVVPDKETFLSKFPEFDIVSVRENPNYLIDELYEDKNKRVLAKVFNQVRNCLNDGDVDEATALYLKASESIVKAKHLESIDILRDTSRYSAYVERCNDFSKYYVTTGFKELDALIGGWDREEELATIAARPGVGKSWILLMVALAAARKGLRVGLYSGEMSERKVGYRLDTLISHIPNGAIMHGNSNYQNEYKRYLDTLPEKIPGELKVITPAMIGGPAGVTALRAFIEKENLDMLCIDQHSLLEDDRRAKNPVERASNISRDLKTLQVLKKIPIIAVSQQNREAAENGPGTANVAQTDRISQDSTILIFLEQKDNKLTMFLSKARDASNGKKLTYFVDFNKGQFEYIPDESGVNLVVDKAETSEEVEDVEGDFFG